MNEKHERQVELALMDQKIQEGKNTLASIIETKQAYLLEREKEAEEVIAEVYARAKSTLESASLLFDEVETIRKEVSNVVHELFLYDNDLKAQKEHFDKWKSEQRARIKAKVAELQACEDNIASERKRIEVQWGQIKGEKENLNQIKQTIADQRARLSAGMKAYGRRTGQ